MPRSATDVAYVAYVDYAGLLVGSGCIPIQSNPILIRKSDLLVVLLLGGLAITTSGGGSPLPLDSSSSSTTEG